MPEATITDEEVLALVAACCRGLDDRKAEDLSVLDVRGRSTVTDYFIIATGNSTPHLRALGGEVEKTLKEAKATLAGSDRNPDSGWLVVDAYSFMVHLFTTEKRDEYRLEELWKDAEKVPLAGLLAEEA